MGCAVHTYRCVHLLTGSATFSQHHGAGRGRQGNALARHFARELQDPTYPTPVFLVDIFSAVERTRSGDEMHGSLIIQRNVLEWRFDPRSETHLTMADRCDLRIVVYCVDG